MQQSIAAVDSHSTAESEFVLSGRSLLSRLWSTATSLGLATASTLARMFDRFDSAIPEAIDLDRIAARLDIVQRARSDGQNEYPASNEETISGGQLEIIAHFRELQRRAQRRIDISSEKTRRMRDRIDLAGLDAALRDIPSRCENEVHRMLAEWQSRLSVFRNDAVEPPERHAPDEKAGGGAAGQNLPLGLQLAFLAALVGVGSMLISKTSAFGFGDDTPVPPVWSIAVLSIVVILSAVVSRAVSTSISHHGTFWKLRKWIRGGIGIAFAGLLAVFASHYLLAMAAITDTSLSAASGALAALFGSLLVERTVPLLPFEDWTVLAVVMAAALSAFVVCYQPDTDSRRQDDARVPVRRTRKERALLIGQLRRVNAKFDRAEAEVTGILKRAKALVVKYARLAEETRQLATKRTDYDYVLENACNMLLDRYRAENARARATAAPYAFREHVCFRGDEDAGSAALADEARRLEECQQGIRTLESQAGQIRQELRKLNARAINALEEAAMH